ncbi:MAG: XRE family transcriptional regulator [Polaromonas sp.]
MAEELASVSPKVLKWARISLGLDVGDVSQEIGKSVEIIENWEAGEASPTYAQLEKLAYTVYKRPLAIFFMDEPPAEPNLKTEFRTFLSHGANRLSKDTYLAVRDAKAKQLYLAEFSPSSVQGEWLKKIGDGLSSQTSMEKVASTAREFLGVTERAISSTQKTEASLSIWRDAVEKAGIYVFKRAFKQSDISGFCLADQGYPIVYLNNKTSFTRQTFTIFHELAHLALGTSGICAVDTEYTSDLNQKDRVIEERCDSFAAEFLVPTKSFKAFDIKEVNDSVLSSIARYFRVSPAVIARKCLDVDLVTRSEYSTLMAHYFRDNWREYKKSEGDESSGNYYNTQLQYLSKRYFTEAFRNYSAGKISASSLADYLGVKVSSLGSFESRVLTRGQFE